MLLVDVHAHLDYYINDGIDAIIENAKKAGVKVIINNGIDLEKNKVSLELAKKYDIVKAALGIYPLKIKEVNVDEEIKFIEKNKNKIIAIGEIGLDGLDKENLEEQTILFQKLINLAEKIKKPIIVHSRKAEEDVINILDSSTIKKVVLHCFSGNFKLVKRASELGYYFSIPTNIVFNQHFQKMAKEININRLLTETDSPYLSPFKDKRNEPAFVIEAVKKIAEIKGFDVEETANSIYLNYKDLFLR